MLTDRPVAGNAAGFANIAYSHERAARLELDDIADLQFHLDNPPRLTMPVLKNARHEGVLLEPHIGRWRRQARTVLMINCGPRLP